MVLPASIRERKWSDMWRDSSGVLGKALHECRGVHSCAWACVMFNGMQLISWSDGGRGQSSHTWIIIGDYCGNGKDRT